MSWEALGVISGFIGLLAGGLIGYGKLMEKVKQLEDDNQRNFSQHEAFYQVEKDLIKLNAIVDERSKNHEQD